MWGVIFGKVRYLCVPLFYLSGFSGSAMLLFLCLLFPQRQGISVKCADSLITILGFQFFFIMIVDNVIGYNLDYIVSIIIALVVFIACVGVHFILLRLCPYVLGRRSVSCSK